MKFYINVGKSKDLLNLILDHAEKLGYDKVDRKQLKSFKHTYLFFYSTPDCSFCTVLDSTTKEGRKYIEEENETSELPINRFFELESSYPTSWRLGCNNIYLKDGRLLLDKSEIPMDVVDEIARALGYSK